MDEVERLLAELENSNVRVEKRLSIIDRFGELKDVRAVPALVEALRDENLDM